MSFLAVEKRTSRQYRWQIKKIAERRCEICGETRNLYARLCDFHAAIERERTRMYSRLRQRRRGMSEERARLLDARILFRESRRRVDNVLPEPETPR
jgi:hypothetical protein